MPRTPPRPATPAEIEDAVMTRTAVNAANWLGFHGRIVSISQCSDAITRLNRTGTRTAMTQGARSAQAESNASADLIRMNCDNLLRAHLRTGKHWITDPGRFAEVCAGVGV